MFLVRALPWPGAADRSVMSISRQQLQTRGVHSRPHSRTRTVPRVGVLTWAPTGRPSVLVVRTYCCMAIWGVRVRKIESIRLHWHGPVVEQGKTHGAVRAPCRFLCREFRARAHAAIAKKKKLLQFFFFGEANLAAASAHVQYPTHGTHTSRSLRLVSHSLMHGFVGCAAG